MLTSLASSSRGIEFSAPGPATSKVLRPTLDLALLFTNDHKPGALSTNSPRLAKYEGLMSSAKLLSARRNKGTMAANGEDINLLIVIDDELVSVLLKKPMPLGDFPSRPKLSENWDSSFLPSAATVMPPWRFTVRWLAMA